MFSQITFSLTEALQISALIPCVFFTLYLLLSIKDKTLAIIPSLYFVSLASGLLYRLMPSLHLIAQEHPQLSFALMFIDIMMPALSFLLIMQMTFSALPPALFWLILAVPVATTPFIYAFLNAPTVCTADIDICFSSEYALHLNMAVVSSFIFLLLTIIFIRRSSEMDGDAITRRYKYWLILCLIIYNLILIGMEMGFVTESIDIQRYIFSKTMVIIAFIYMIMTSIFRVFSDHFEIQPTILTLSRAPLTEYETSVGLRAEKILNSEKVYRELGFNRASFAKKLGVREHVLSRIINLYFNKSFSELANEYRIREAKELLINTNSSITAISYDVGFSSITSFNRVFKEITELSPSEFREMPHKKIAEEIHNAEEVSRS